MARWILVGFILGYCILGPWAYQWITCCPGVGLKGPG